MHVGDPEAPGLPAGTVTPAPSSADLRRALAVVRQHLPPTPLVEASPGVFHKLEYETPTGAFKMRGALAAAAQAVGRGASQLVAASAGNHGIGLAFAAHALGVRATIVVPSTTPSGKRARIEALGAELIVSASPSYDAAEDEARALAAQVGAQFCSPFDDTAVMAGNGGTVALEIIAALADSGQRPGTIVLPVGGGGLLAGVLAALDDAELDADVVAVQSEACPSFFASLRDGRAYTRWDGAPTLAHGLEGGTGETAVVLALARGVRAVLVSETSIAAAIERYQGRTGVELDGSAAVVLAADAEGSLQRLREPAVFVLTGRASVAE